MNFYFIIEEVTVIVFLMSIASTMFFKDFVPEFKLFNLYSFSVLLTFTLVTAAPKNKYKIYDFLINKNISKDYLVDKFSKKIHREIIYSKEYKSPELNKLVLIQKSRLEDYAKKNFINQKKLPALRIVKSLMLSNRDPHEDNK
jgi:hypothetical protein